MFGSIPRPRGGRFPDCCECRLYLHEGEDLYVAWPDCIQVSLQTVCLGGAVQLLLVRMQFVHDIEPDCRCAVLARRGGLVRGLA
jgi:hypothetical protein